MSEKKELQVGNPVLDSSDGPGVDQSPILTTAPTGRNEIPLARHVDRRVLLTRLISSLTWINGASPSVVQSSSDISFQNGLLDGMVYKNLKRSSQQLKNRIEGTMVSGRKGFQLPRDVEDIRRRQEHVDRRIVQMPVLLSEYDRNSSAARFVAVVRNASLCELRDLYRILSSMDARKFDICESDVRALFEWFVTFENSIRLYLTASEMEIYVASDIDVWGALEGRLAPLRRKREKKRIVSLCEQVEGMKRVMIADDRRCGKHMEELRRRVDDFAMRLVRFLNEESAQLQGKLELGYSQPVIDELFSNMVQKMRCAESGKDALVLISRGIGTDSESMASWAREMCSSSKIAVSMRLSKFIDRHISYAILFEKAEQEYRDMYRKLSDELDDEIADIHDACGKRVS